MKIDERFENTFDMLDSETDVTLQFTTQSSARPLDICFVLCYSYPLGKAYAMQYHYVSANLVDDGNGDTFEVRFRRGEPSGGYDIRIHYIVIASTDISVIHASYSYSSYSITDDTVAVDPTNTIPIVTYRTTSSGQELENFVQYCEIDSGSVTFEKYTNTKTLEVEAQFVQSSTFDVGQVIVSNTDFNPQTGALPSVNGSTAYSTNSFMLLNYKANSQMEGAGSYKVAYYDDANDEYVIKNYDTSYSSSAQCILYFVKISNSELESTNYEQIGFDTTSTNLTFTSKYTELSNTFFVPSALQGYLYTTSEEFESRHDIVSGVVKNGSNAGEVDWSKHSSEFPTEGYFSVIELTPSTTGENFYYLHYVGRGVNIGVNNGIE